MAWRCYFNNKAKATTAIGIGIMRRARARARAQPQPPPFASSSNYNYNLSHSTLFDVVVDNIIQNRTRSRTPSVVSCVLSSRRSISQNINAGNEAQLNRDLFIRLWSLDHTTKNTASPPHHHRKTKRVTPKETQYCSSSSSSVGLKQPPPSESITGFLQPTSSLEAHVAPLLARSNLLITRDIEWANLVLGFEQESRYAVVDVCYPQAPVGFIREQSNVIVRQLLRTRRPFVAYITDALGNVLFTVRRPFWWMTSSIYVEIDGKEVGVVHRHWHLWRRIYDLYLGNKQFAVVENPGFWNWTFTLKDIDGNVLAEIDRNWRGFGFELFTDAGQYVIRFGSTDPTSKTGPARKIQELEVARPLTLSERAVAVALAISLDNDYFSVHGGWGIPFIAVTE